MDSQSPIFDGDSLLHVAVRQGQIEDVRNILVHQYLDVNILNFKLETPLHLACSQSASAIVQLLIAFGADPYITDSNNVTAYGKSTFDIQITMYKLLYGHDVWINSPSLTNGDTPLHNAVRLGTLEKVQGIFDRQIINVNAMNSSHETPLHIACELGHELIVHLLISNGAEIYIRDCYSNISIHRAASQGHVNILDCLITDYACDPKFTGYQDRTLLHFACSNGNTDLVNTLIQKYGISPMATDAINQTPLHIAASYGQEEVVCLLITKYNTPVDCRNNRKLSPLHLASYCGHVSVVKRLVLEYKADVNALDGTGSTPFLKAAMGGNLGLIQMMITEFNLDPLVAADGSGNTPLHLTCWGGHEELARLLITKYNCPVDVKNKNKQTPLHIACSFGCLHVVKVFISEFKANMDAHDHHTNTPLNVAVLHGHTDIVQMLITEFGCSPQVKGYEGRSLLHQACDKGKTKLAIYLITDYNLDPLSADDGGNTPLHLACLSGHEELVRLLITKYKCSVNCINNYGHTLLHLAVGKGHTDLYILLISEFKIKCNVLDGNRNTPLDIAINNGDAKAVHILATEYGCKPHIKGCETKPLLHQICAGGFATVLQELISNFNHDPASVDEDGNTLLHTAALYGKHEVVESLFGIHYPIDCRNSQGQTPLHCACIGGHTKVADLLVQNGAQTSIKDEDGNSPLKKAYIMNNADVLATILLSLGYDSTVIEPKLLYQACEHDSVDLADILLTEFNLDPSSILDDQGNTPLHIAALCGYKEMVSLLLTKYNCYVNCRNAKEQTPLHLICSQRLSDPIERLIKLFVSVCGADVTIRDGNGDQPIHISAQAGCTNVITTLIVDYDCNPHSKGFKNRTLLHQALERGHTSTAKALIEVFHLSVHSTDNGGNTPLHLSSLSGHPESVKLLLYDYHVPIFVRNKAGKTPIDLANNNSIKLVFKNYTHSEHKTIQAEYEELLSLSSQKYSGQHNITRVFVLGNPGSGKSTLVESLKRKGIIASRLLVPKADVPLHTAGIVPSIHQSKDAGRLLYFDFAGDKQYYSSHSAILEMVSHSNVGHSVYLIAVNMTNGNDTLYNELGYWLSFISYHAKILDSHDKLKVIIVLSHYDLLTSSDSADKLDSIKYYLKNNSDRLKEWNLSIIDIIPSNCRKPRSSKAVVDSIVQMSKSASPYTLSTDAALLNGALEKDFRNVITCKIQTLLSHIKATGICLPTEAYALYPIVKELHDIGVLMMIGRYEDQFENYLLLTDISSLTNEVHQILFSESAEQKFLSTVSSQYAKMGIFPERFISSILPDHITKECLVQLQYCQEFSHADVGLDYSVTQNTESNDLLLYFPALCHLEREHANWPHDPDLNLSIGWYAKCVGKLDYLPPRYLHVLLLRLTFMFALPASTTPTSDLDLSISLQAQDCHCTMWKNGIHWLMREGVECIVEVVNENKGVVVVVKSRKQHTYQCIHMLTQIADVVTEAKAEFCNSVSLRYFIMKSDDPSSYSNEDKLYDVNQVKSAIENNNETVFSINGRQTFTLESLKLLKCHTCWGKFMTLTSVNI